MPALRANLVCHLWDLAAEGVDEVLDRVQGELGLTGVCIPVVCPPISQLRARPGDGPRIFRSAGGAFFNPQDRHYAATRCKPIAAAPPKLRDLFGRVVDACRNRRLDCRAVVYVTRAGPMAGRYPQAAAKTAFGDAWADRVCPVNPDVQALLAATCDDLVSNYGITGIELAELHAGRLATVSSSLDLGFDLGPGGQALLGVCFCESCRQLAGSAADAGGLDASAAARSVEVRLARVFHSGEPLPGPVPQVFADDPPLRVHLAAQWRAIRQGLESIPRQPGCDLIVRTYDDVITDHPGGCPLIGDDPSRSPDAVLAVPGVGPADAIEQTARVTLQQAGDRMRAEMVIRPCGDDTSSTADAPTLVRTLSRLAELGLASVDLESYGTIPTAGLTAIKQAARFARRTPIGPAPEPPA